MPSGHTTVPASGSIVTWAKYAGSFSGSRTPVHRSAEKSTSPAVPSLNSRRSTCSPTTATPATTGRYFSLMATMLRQRRYGEQRLAAPRPFPIGHQFGAVELGPVPDEPCCPVPLSAYFWTFSELTRMAVKVVLLIEAWSVESMHSKVMVPPPVVNAVVSATSAFPTASPASWLRFTSVAATALPPSGERMSHCTPSTAGAVPEKPARLAAEMTNFPAGRLRPATVVSDEELSRTLTTTCFSKAATGPGGPLGPRGPVWFQKILC